MGKKEPVIKTKRLIIQPMTNEEIQHAIKVESKEEMKAAYEEMLLGCMENKASQRVLEKLGFVFDREGKEGPRFVAEQPLTNWMSIYMLFGLSIGMSLGSAADKIGVGMSLGMCIGMCIGIALDSHLKKDREKLKEERKTKPEENE